jgi:hypothetical protein
MIHYIQTLSATNALHISIHFETLVAQRLQERSH